MQQRIRSAEERGAGGRRRRQEEDSIQRIKDTHMSVSIQRTKERMSGQLRRRTQKTKATKAAGEYHI
eukprot:11512902-Prorocentrum_lima.AAC.1